MALVFRIVGLNRTFNRMILFCSVHMWVGVVRKWVCEVCCAEQMAGLSLKSPCGRLRASWRWGYGTAWWEGEAAPAPVCTAGFPDVGCWALLLLWTTAPWKGLGAHVSTYCPQWVLRKSGSGGAELSDTQDMIAAGHRGWLNAWAWESGSWGG